MSQKFLFTEDSGDSSDLNYQLKGELNVIETDWNIPTEFPDLTGYKEVAVDLETKDPNLTTLGPGWATNNGHIIGIAVAAGEYKGYFPMRHENGHNMDPRITLKWIKKQLSVPEMDVIMHNATYDAGWLRAEGVEIKGRIIDTMVTGALVDENRWSFGLDAMARDYAGVRKNEQLLKAAAADFGVNPKSEMYKLPPKFVGGYAEQDAVATLKLWSALKVHLDKEELWDVWNMETGLIRCILDMRTKGVRVDLDRADENKKALQKQSKLLRGMLEKEAGMEVDIWASASIQKMFDKLKMEYPRTEKGAPSFTKSFLNEHPEKVAQILVKLREFDKADSTFIDSILRHEHNGRIHTELHSTRRDSGGTVTGRFSSSNPNLQQLPARDPDIKRYIRGIFIPEEGQKWGSFDYSSQEPRLLVHFAASLKGDNKHPIVDTIVEEYNTGDVDLHQMVADLAGITRKEAKVVNLGIMYGMGKGKLGDQLGISTEEAGDLLQKHQDKVPFVKNLANLASSQAEKTGQIRTLLGRRCRFNMWEPRTYGYSKPLEYEPAMKKYGQPLRRAFTYKALNKLIQGSAADQTKKAMADCYAEGLLPMLTVHDELCFSVESDEQAKRIKDIMENGLSDVLKVPSKVDDELKDNWGEIE